MLAELALGLMKLVLGSGPGEMDGVAVPFEALTALWIVSRVQ